uniref:Ig-like domain-containing protein n=1 Tax=Branchiostoma floridae TaxID=7739 RepID=C3XYR2_BRAFL|eukprot:XP_002610937.1 hypothetical protein BRAFLDRAFT_105604 [Branchiostoma floridae]
MTTLGCENLITVLVLLVTWNRSSCTAVQSNLDCCDLNPFASILTCWKNCNFNNIPAPLALPTNLQYLLIRQQDIRKIKAGDFPRHEILESLYIWDSNVVELDRGAFASLPSLKLLNLRRNKIRQLKPETFKGLASLITLELEDNEIHQIDSKAFVGLFRLGFLTLNNNCLSGIPREIWSFDDIELLLSDNPITWITDVEELRRISTTVSLSLRSSHLQCDCKLREVKSWLLENNHLRWYIWCMVGDTRKQIKDVDWKDLRCASPNVSISLDNGTATGKISLTCRTDCREGLAFVWVTPSGDYKPPSYQYSNNYTHVSRSSCKGSPVTSWESRRMCYSVLNIPSVGNDAKGTYTCQVTADHTDNASASAVLLLSNDTENTTRVHMPELQTTATIVTLPAGDKAVDKEKKNRPKFELSAAQLILVGLGSFCGCSIIIGVIAACVSKCQVDGANEQRDAGDGHHGTSGRSSDSDGAENAQYENDDQFSDTVGAAGGHYENDGQFSDTVGAAGGHYENDDQFSDTEGATGGHYENDDQLSDTEGATGGHYENDDQFSDTEGATGGHYENDDQFSDTEGATGGHYENDDQLSDTEGATGGHYENDDQLSDTKGATGGHYENDDQLSDTDGATGGHYENDDQFSDAGVSKHLNKTAPGKPTSVKPENAPSSATAKRTRPSQNKRGLATTRAVSNNKMAMSVSHIVAIHAEAQASGQYDNDRKDGRRNLNDRNATATSAGRASDDREQTAGHYDNDKTANASNTTERADDDSDSDHDYMSLPGDRSAERETEHGELESKAEDKSPVSTFLGATEASEDEYVTPPDTENASGDHTYITLPDTENAGDDSDHAYITLPDTENAGDNSDHTNLTHPDTENAGDNSDHTNLTHPDTENAGDNSDHTNLTHPDTENAGDDSDHTYVTFPDKENAEERHMETEQKDK